MKKRYIRVSEGLNDDYFCNYINDDGVSQTSWNYSKTEKGLSDMVKSFHWWMNTVNPSGQSGSSQWAIGR